MDRIPSFNKLSDNLFHNQQRLWEMAAEIRNVSKIKENRTSENFRKNCEVLYEKPINRMRDRFLNDMNYIEYIDTITNGMSDYIVIEKTKDKIVIVVQEPRFINPHAYENMEDYAKANGLEVITEDDDKGFKSEKVGDLERTITYGYNKDVYPDGRRVYTSDRYINIRSLEDLKKEVARFEKDISKFKWAIDFKKNKFYVYKPKPMP